MLVIGSHFCLCLQFGVGIIQDLRESLTADSVIVVSPLTLMKSYIRKIQTTNNLQAILYVVASNPIQVSIVHKQLLHNRRCLPTANKKIERSMIPLLITWSLSL